jgi:hypothetical protein
LLVRLWEWTLSSAWRVIGLIWLVIVIIGAGFDGVHERHFFRGFFQSFAANFILSLTLILPILIGLLVAQWVSNKTKSSWIVGIAFGFCFFLTALAIAWVTDDIPGISWRIDRFFSHRNY